MSLLWWWEETDSGDEADTATSTDGETGRSKADVLVETGLTPEEYILAAIESNGGRMKQQTICGYTGWSAGTISEILSQMEADGTITRGRIGRGKVVSLPESRSRERHSRALASSGPR